MSENMVENDSVRVNNISAFALISPKFKQRASDDRATAKSLESLHKSISSLDAFPRST